MSNEYLNNREFEGIILRFQKAKKDKNDCDEKILDGTLNVDEVVMVHAEYDEVKKYLSAAFFTLSDNLARYAKFTHIDIDDAVQEGVMICFDKIDRFNPAMGKAFNYMTTCILNHFRQLYRTARNYNELKKRYHNHLNIMTKQYGRRDKKAKNSDNVSYYDNF